MDQSVAGSTPLARYESALHQPGFVADDCQRQAVMELQRLYTALCCNQDRKSWWHLFARQGKQPVRGIYIWGKVGRGKTWLMDNFFETLPFENKLRRHFHRFMRDIHRELAALKQEADPLKIVAAKLAGRAGIVCFDEFFVEDIADAMLLGNLFTALFENGVTLVATSNVPPDDLYLDGLQRQNFLPAIQLIKRHTRVLHMDGQTDYRLRELRRLPLYHCPANAAAEQALTRTFDSMSGSTSCADETVNAVSIEIEGRPIPLRRQADGVIWFDFDAICDGPRSQLDYIELARSFHTVIISNVPALTGDREDPARRFIALVDEFYDHSVKLILSADTPLSALYRGRRHSSEFQRTASRLREMQNHEYLARAHRP